ncbi:MAG TPA: trypsin-like peptidase domain-containing protein [Candidatus Limnocylindrales bacterium]|nr:trypsin-like peptidase domain-containing protein [Candidatus Limnocylindrales bacterium]
MSDRPSRDWAAPRPYAAPPPPPPPARPGGVAALVLAGVFVGAVAGGAAGAIVAGRAEPPGASPLPTSALPTATPLGGELPEDAVVAVVDEVGPAVVTVINRLPSGAQQASGSGFVIDAERGYIVTNSHVISNVRGPGVGASFQVVFSDDRTEEARLVGHDDVTDVAVLEVPADGLTAAILGNSEEVPIGARVVAIGSALGLLESSVTSGVVSGKGRRLQSQRDPNLFLEDLVQTDAAISPGNSGGPLIWAARRVVIGMNTLVLRPANAEGLGFAVSSNTIRQIADELIRNGQVERGRIGIGYTNLGPQDAQAAGLPPGTNGILVGDVITGSPAEQAGIRPGDIITKVNERQIDPEHPLATIMLRYRPGDRVAFTMFRDGREMVVEVTLGRP